MSPLDASFLHVEDAVTHMHIGSVGLFEGPVPRAGEVRDAVAARLPLVPRYRQKVRFVPLALGRPTWVDDPHFNLEYHVRRTALPDIEVLCQGIERGIAELAGVGAGTAPRGRGRAVTTRGGAGSRASRD